MLSINDVKSITSKKKLISLEELSELKQNKITSENKLSADLIDGLAVVATSGDFNDLDGTDVVVTTDTTQTITGTKKFLDLNVSDSKNQTIVSFKVDSTLGIPKISFVGRNVGNLTLPSKTGTLATLNDITAAVEEAKSKIAGNYVTLATDQTISGKKTIANDFNTQSILPISAGTYSLGSDELYYKDLYLNNITIPSLDGVYKFVFKATKNGVSIGNGDYKGNYMAFIKTHGYGISLCISLEPSKDNTLSLGAENYRFKDLYLSGSISDKINSITVSEIVAKQDKLVAGDNITISEDNVISSDLSEYAKLSDLGSYVSKSGDTMTGALNVPTINDNNDTTQRTISTGTNGNSYFQSRKFRGQGDASTYAHAIDFGYAGHDRMDFYEYGGTFNFWANRGSTKLEGDANRVASLQSGKLVERGYTLTYPGKSGTIALIEDIPSTIEVTGEITTDDEKGIRVTKTNDEYIVAHQGYVTGEIKPEEISDTEPYIMTAIEVDKGHVTKVIKQALIDALKELNLRFDCGTANLDNE